MNNAVSGQPPACDSSIWIQNLVNGLCGMTFKVKHAVFCDASPFQKVEVFDTYGFGRILMLAGNVVVTERDEHIYSEMIAHPALLMHPCPKRVCVIGGGDGGAAREALKHRCVESVTVVEIDELVTRTVSEHFPALRTGLADPRTSVVFEDGCRYLENARDTFDVIIVDSYDPGGPVQSITSEPFYPLVHERLANDGIAVFQTDSPTLRGEALRAAVCNASALFAESHVYLCSIPSFPEGICSFVVAGVKAGVLEGFDEKRYEHIAEKCRYYNREVHTGAFLLPRVVRDTVLS